MKHYPCCLCIIPPIQFLTPSKNMQMHTNYEVMPVPQPASQSDRLKVAHGQSFDIHIHFQDTLFSLIS